MSLPSLSILIPVYNEPEWIPRSIAAVDAAILNSPFQEAEIVVVDDGSAEPTKTALRSAAPRTPLRVFEQDNQGRFAARRKGISEAQGDVVLMTDSRVLLAPDSLTFLAKHWTPEKAVWNGHCMIAESGPYSRFWDTLTHAALPAYLSNPRTTSFGLEEYDRYPKGTSHFVAPRELLLDAIESFSSHYTDTRFSSDDTHLLRAVAARQRINISPGFASEYHSRTSLRSFLKHAFHRGTVFFDGFARPGSRFLPALIAFFPATLGAFGVVMRRPRVAVGCTVTGMAAAGILATRLRRPWRHVIATASLSPLFAVAFTLGVWRGAALALTARRDR